MRVVIAGGGSVGRFIGQELQGAGHDVLIMDNDPGVVKRAQLEGEPKGVDWFRADACEVSRLTEARVGDADVVAAVTGDDEDNLVACQVAKGRFDVPQTIARLNDPRNQHLFKSLGIDVTVSATTAILDKIELELPFHRLHRLLHLRKSDLEMVEIQLPQNAPVAGQAVKDVPLPPGSLIVLLVDTEGTPRLPTAAAYRAGDEVIAITRGDTEDALRAALTGQRDSL